MENSTGKVILVALGIILALLVILGCGATPDTGKVLATPTQKWVMSCQSFGLTKLPEACVLTKGNFTMACFRATEGVGCVEVK